MTDIRNQPPYEGTEAAGAMPTVAPTKQSTQPVLVPELVASTPSNQRLAQVLAYGNGDPHRLRDARKTAVRMQIGDNIPTIVLGAATITLMMAAVVLWIVAPSNGGALPPWYVVVPALLGTGSAGGGSVFIALRKKMATGNAILPADPQQTTTPEDSPSDHSGHTNA